MYKVNVEKQCGCFKRSDMDAQKSFDSKDEALIEAHNMVKTMNDEFCQKHSFHVIENENTFVVMMKQ